MPLSGQLRGEVASRTRRPPQRRHRITALVGLHQCQQRGDKARVIVGQPFTTAAGPTDPAQRSLSRLQFGDPSETVASRIPAARAANRIPPCPIDLASTATANRRWRSSRCGSSAANFAANAVSASSDTPTPQA